MNRFFSNLIGEKDSRIQGVKGSRSRGILKAQIAKELAPLFKRGISAIVHDRIGPCIVWSYVPSALSVFQKMDFRICEVVNTWQSGFVKFKNY